MVWITCYSVFVNIVVGTMDLDVYSSLDTAYWEMLTLVLLRDAVRNGSVMKQATTMPLPIYIYTETANISTSTFPFLLHTNQ